MQKLKSILQILQKDNKVQNLKSLLTSPTFLLIVAAFISVGLVTWLNIRPFALLFLAIFICFLFKQYIYINIKMSDECKNHLAAMWKSCTQFRQNQPLTFSIIGYCWSAALLLLGQLVSGTTVLLTSLILATIIAAKYNFHIFEVEEEDFGFAWLEQQYQQEYALDDEFLPEENESNLFVLERARTSLTLPTDDDEDDEDKSDEVPSELLIPDPIPEIDENSTDDDQDDLLPIVPESRSESQIKNSKPATDALVKYSQSSDIMEFKKGHFKRDSSISSSSSSEESLSKGLQFPDHTVVDGIRPKETAMSQQEVSKILSVASSSQNQNLLANSSKLLPTLMTGLIQGVLSLNASASAAQSAQTHDTSNRRIVTALDSSDESDFEVLEREDFE